jgi:hypothetical protein
MFPKLKLLPSPGDIIIIIIISYSLFTGFSWYFSSWNNGEPHQSGFK